jgi:ATP-binding cassette, subfamily B, multidrug efflux pump
MFRFFENLLSPTVDAADSTPPAGLVAFYWHYARQARGLLVALFVAGTLVALMDLLIPIFIGRVVNLVSAHTATEVLRDYWPDLLAMAVVQLGLRPLVLLGQNLIANQGIVANLTNLVRWQSHWHVVRQGWSFFQNDFAGRIANRIMQTGPSLRDSIVSGTNAVWYILVYGTSAILLLSRSDGRLAIPILAWFMGYILMLRWFVPRMRDRSRALSEARSALTGRVVDSYTNILTVKLFARPRDEDAFVRASVDEHNETYRRQLRMMTFFTLCLSTMNAAMVVGTGGTAIGLWAAGQVNVGVVAMALPLAWQMQSMSGWVAFNITSIFENVGTVQDGMKSIAIARTMRDRDDAAELHVSDGQVQFEDVHFGYGTARGVLHGVDLTIKL